MTESLPPSMHQDLEAWEREAAAYWDRLTRSPEVLDRVGQQIARTLESQQRIVASLQKMAWGPAPLPARELTLLERLSQQIESLADRIDRLETRLHNE